MSTTMTMSDLDRRITAIDRGMADVRRAGEEYARLLRAARRWYGTTPDSVVLLHESCAGRCQCICVIADEACDDCVAAATRDTRALVGLPKPPAVEDLLAERDRLLRMKAVLNRELHPPRRTAGRGTSRADRDRSYRLAHRGAGSGGKNGKRSA